MTGLDGDEKKFREKGGKTPYFDADCADQSVGDQALKIGLGADDWFAETVSRKR